MNALASINTVFLDNGGVLSDHSLMGPQYRRLVGEFFAPRLGGTHEKWAEANRVVFARLWASGFDTIDYWKWWRGYQLSWLRGMAEHVGVTAPESEQFCFDLAHEAALYITARVSAPIPGAAHAVTALHATGLVLHTASSGNSFELQGCLAAMGVRQFLHTLYGSDLVSQFKNSPEYYRQILAHSGADPSRSLVIDDSPAALSWAKEAGARTCLVTSRQNTALTTMPDLVVPSLTTLADLLKA